MKLGDDLPKTHLRRRLMRLSIESTGPEAIPGRWWLLIPAVIVLLLLLRSFIP